MKIEQNTNLISFTKSSYTSMINDLVDKALNQLSSGSFKVFITAYRNIFGYGKKIWGWLSNTKIKEKANLSENTIRKALAEAEEKGFIKIYHEKVYGVTRQYIVFICEENKELLSDLENKKASFADLENEKIAYLTTVKLAKTLDIETQKLNPVPSKVEGSTLNNCVKVPSIIEPIKHTTNKTNILNINKQTEERNNVDDFLKKELVELKEKINNFIHPTNIKFTTLKFKIIENEIYKAHDPKLKLKAFTEQLDYLPFRVIKSDLESCYFASVNGSWSIPKDYFNPELNKKNQEQLEKDTAIFLPLVEIWDKTNADTMTEKEAEFIINQYHLPRTLKAIREANNIDKLDLSVALIEKINKSREFFDVIAWCGENRKKEIESIYDRYSELVAA